MKFFSERGVRAKTQRDCGAVDTAAVLRVHSHKLCVVLNWQSAGSDRILTEVSKWQATCSGL
jgi:hypothetical protein